MFEMLIVFPGLRSTELSHASVNGGTGSVGALAQVFAEHARGLVEPMDKELGINKRRGAKQR